ncbi:MAG: RnfABCDGE type electron transport complex subunit D, partial [Myxococcota bacterium]|nr:RnfABCDGE type electron transport complex subunit D [Myxococcota bacterium]
MRDALDLRRTMRLVLLAAAPAALVGVANAGYQALDAARRLGVTPLAGWRGAPARALGLAPDPESLLACLAFGLACVLPVAVVAAVSGLIWERIFAVRRSGRRDEALPVVVAFFVLVVPP